MTTTLLQGIRAIDMTEVWAGPMGTSLLGDLGADVIRLESFPRPPAISRPLREGNAAPGEGPPYERAGSHHMANRNKRNIAVNIRSEGGAEVMRRLVASVDVLVEGYSAGTIEGLGFGWQQLRELNPRLVMLSMPGWGVEGPYRGYATLGSGLDATLGHMAIRGYPDGPPDQVPTMFHTDATGAVGLVTAVVAGLLRREENGEGCFIDMSQAEAFAWQLPGLFAAWTMNHRIPRRLGNAEPHVVPHGCYRAAGGEAGAESWVAIAAETDRQWRGVAVAAGHPEWAESPHPWATVTGRMRSRDAIDSALTAFVGAGIAEDVATSIANAGGIAAPVIAHVGLMTSPQLAAREWLQTVTHRYAGTQTLPGFLWRVEPDEPSWDLPCGLVGEHNAEVLGQLGYGADEIAELIAQGAIGDRYGG
jgi:crotonobetainyl-CoA:carnitine CoA-transferase CaiB-like acyl-CoA transferase